MPFPTFDDFIKEYPRCSKFHESESARLVFEYASRPLHIYNMIMANEEGKPALYGILPGLEHKFAGSKDFDFETPFVKQTVGMMIKFILSHFGYVSDKQRDMPSKYMESQERKFTSAMHYKKEGLELYELIPTFEVKQVGDAKEAVRL